MANDKRRHAGSHSWKHIFRQRWRSRRPIRSSDIVVGMALAALAIVLIVRSAAKLLSFA